VAAPELAASRVLRGAMAPAPAMPIRNGSIYFFLTRLLIAGHACMDGAR
jgi:hypothetical protein